MAAPIEAALDLIRGRSDLIAIDRRREFLTPERGADGGHGPVPEPLTAGVGNQGSALLSVVCSTAIARSTGARRVALSLSK
jgi:hypothetical protein